MKLKKILFGFFVIICICYYLFEGFNDFYFLRQPIRNVPHDDSLFVSPANGTVIKVMKQDELTDGDTELYKKNNIVIDDWTQGFSGATLVSIMMTPLDAHFQKAPLLSKLIDQQYQKGHFYNATKTDSVMKSTFQNEYNNMLYITPEGYKFRIIQIAGLMARRIVSLLENNDIVEQGQFIGAIKLGSQVSVVLDEHFDVQVKEGDYVIDGETIIAKKFDETHVHDIFEDGNIVGAKDVNMDVDNVIRYSVFEMIHPSEIATCIWFLIIIVQVFAGLKIFEIAKIKKWKLFVPIYNVYLLFKFVGKGKLMRSFLMIPLFFWFLLTYINTLENSGILIYIFSVLFVVCMAIPWIIVQFYVVKKFGKSKIFALGLGIFTPIFYPYLAFFNDKIESNNLDP